MNLPRGQPGMGYDCSAVVPCWADQRINETAENSPCGAMTKDPLGLCPAHRKELVNRERGPVPAT
jgi:hypothetical protein